MDRLITRNQLDATPVRLWRESPPLLNGELAQLIQDWNETVLNEACLMLQHYRGRGVFKADLDVEFTALLLNDYLNLAFLRLAISPTQDLEWHCTHVRNTIELFCHGTLAPPEAG